MSASRLALFSIVVSLLVLALKTLAWKLTLSAALFSDALESIVNVAASVMAYGAIRYSAQPPDENHPFGHSKGELLAAIVEGAMIVAAAVLILQHGVHGLASPSRIEAPLRGIAVNAAASVLNGAWGGLLLSRGRPSGSPALLAEGRHLLTDVATSAGLVVGLLLVVATGIQRIDPLLAILVAVYILWSGYALVRDSVGGLMDEAPGANVVHRIEALVAEHASGALQVHDVRTRRAGQRTFLQFHLVVPGEMPVCDAHEICDRIEAGIGGAMPQVVTTIHVEPAHKAKSTGALVL